MIKVIFAILFPLLFLYGCGGEADTHNSFSAPFHYTTADVVINKVNETVPQPDGATFIGCIKGGTPSTTPGAPNQPGDNMTIEIGITARPNSITDAFARTATINVRKAEIKMEKLEGAIDAPIFGTAESLLLSVPYNTTKTLKLEYNTKAYQPFIDMSFGETATYRVTIRLTMTEDIFSLVSQTGWATKDIYITQLLVLGEGRGCPVLSN